MSIAAADLTHLRRCVELAREALEDGDDPFGSVRTVAPGVPTTGPVAELADEMKEPHRRRVN
jgi:hypothetical protein